MPQTTSHTILNGTLCITAKFVTSLLYEAAAAYRPVELTGAPVPPPTGLQGPLCWDPADINEKTCSVAAEKSAIAIS